MKYTLKNKEIELTQEEVQEIIKQNSTPQEEKVVGLAIKNRFTGEIIFQSTKTTWKEAIIERGDADLRYADLSNANLSNANLSNADLSDADLRYADLSNANLSNANLSDADLRYADLRDANLSNANLSDADLRNAEMQNVKFYGKGGTKKLTKAQVPDFLNALGFQIE